jgi:hypothetical protein
MGDGVLIYFGYPQAHEDDAEQAVRAGLALIEAVGALKSAVSLQTRVGIATGLVVVGDLIGSGEAQERGIVGETPNLASRLQGLATPASVVIAASTRQQIGDLFELEDLGPKVVAGLAEPQRAWRVLGDSGEVSRFAALRSERSALIGRDEEVELLMRRWKQAKTGEGRVVLISGEAGIGKSRLTTWLSEHIRSESHTRMRYFCAPHTIRTVRFIHSSFSSSAPQGSHATIRPRPSSVNFKRSLCRACGMTVTSRCCENCYHCRVLRPTSI